MNILKIFYFNKKILNSPNFYKIKKSQKNLESSEKISYAKIDKKQLRLRNFSQVLV